MTGPHAAGGGPRLVVRAPAGREPERRYVLDLILEEWLGLPYALEAGPPGEVTIRPAGDAAGPRLALPDILFATPDEDWLTPRALPLLPLGQIRPPAGDGGPAGSWSAGAIPVPYGRPSVDEAPWQATGEGLTLAVDVLGSAFLLLSRLEEAVRPDRDEHDRFPVSASLAHAAGFVERPLVDELVDLLGAAMRALWPGFERPATTFRLRLTHDIDRPFSALGQPAWTIGRSLAADLVRRREPRLALRRVRAVADARRGRVDRDPFATFGLLMATSERHGLRSTFYFMAGNVPGDEDFRYRLDDPHFAPILREVHERGHEIGLHGSYGSHGNPERLRMEAAALAAACGAAGVRQEAWGTRQHYLRFANPATWRAQERAGLVHDSTIGYAEVIGFRAGTCREHPVFDLHERRTMRLRERPLVVMDASLFGYMGLGLEEATRRARAVVGACRRHRGDAVVLYHNDTLVGARQQAQYRELVEELARP